MKLIKIKWEGPLNQNEVLTKNKSEDYGLYQVYGNHRIYGKNVLLYIGKAEEQKFHIRIPQHDDWFEYEEAELKFYLGRFIDESNIEYEEWNKQIKCSEIALINYCQPAWNSAHLNSNSSTLLYTEYVILNLADKKELPEILPFNQQINSDSYNYLINNIKTIDGEYQFATDNKTIVNSTFKLY